MTQINHGVRSILSHPVVYNAFQALMGAKRVRTLLATKFIRAEPNMNVLDAGCGPAEILDYLPNVNYWGFDISESYIAQASSRYKENAVFNCKILVLDDLKDLPQFDLVLALGLLHHLNDEEAQHLLYLSYQALKVGGRLITIDPCFEKGQNPIARYLISKDRGQNVRTEQGYKSLISNIYSKYRLEVHHTAWIPYTHCYTECTRT